MDASHGPLTEKAAFEPVRPHAGRQRDPAAASLLYGEQMDDRYGRYVVHDGDAEDVEDPVSVEHDLQKRADEGARKTAGAIHPTAGLRHEHLEPEGVGARMHSGVLSEDSVVAAVGEALVEPYRDGITTTCFGEPLPSLGGRVADDVVVFVGAEFVGLWLQDPVATQQQSVADADDRPVLLCVAKWHEAEVGPARAGASGCQSVAAVAAPPADSGELGGVLRIAVILLYVSDHCRRHPVAMAAAQLGDEAVPGFGDATEAHDRSDRESDEDLHGEII
ncbi:F-box protein-like [Iris pallida]|uniref:F-box protein-like n=1 Tax=Iris pallida TaxID=29817 RepID=A0AAX6H6F2_IRIPA|nr:F-box protein-like [Iris pallida]